MKTFLCDALKQLKENKVIPFHMPGHKRKYCDIFEEIGNYDITEISGYDNLHCPEGIIKESMEELKRIYHTKKSWYLVNGSTCGIQAAIASVCKPGDEIVIGRNCHKAVYHIVELLRLKVHYLMPQISEKYHLSLGMEENEREQLKKIIHDHKIKAVVITSPTYEGVVTDISSIQKILQPEKIPLIVDEAHGAHFMFHDYFPESAVEKGADLVIQSAHKTLPAFTQTGLLHLCSEEIKEKKVQDYLSVFETSSPSYLLLASAEYGVSYVDKNVDKVQQYVDNLDDFITKCGQLKHISLLSKDKIDCYDLDRSKLVFLLRNASMDGKELFEKLYNKYHIELEMANRKYCIAMTSVMDRKEDFDRLFEALKEIDSNLKAECEDEDLAGCGDVTECEDLTGYKDLAEHEDLTEYRNSDMEMAPIASVFEKVMEPWECEEYDQEDVVIEKSQGRICCSYVSLYPPGIPLLVPGEKILKEIVENIRYYLYNGYNVTGLQEDKITVIK